MDSREILGVKIDYGMTKEDVLKRIEEFISSGKSHYLCTVNPEFVMDAQGDESFRNIINKSDLSLPDGVGLLYAKFYEERVKNLSKDILFPIKAFIVGLWYGLSSLFIKYNLGERLSGSDLIYDLCALAEDRGYTVFFLGGWPRNRIGRGVRKNGYIAERTVEEFKKIFPSLKVIGSTSGFTYKRKDDIRTLNYIKDTMLKGNVTHIDILFVAYGHKKQEAWIERNIEKIPARVGMGVGASFDYVIGTQTRAPRKFIQNNLEWLHRLFTQPWRITRIAKAFPIFPLTVYLSSFRTSKKK